MDVKELAERFVKLIEERDFIVEFNTSVGISEIYNDRCIEIDDREIPAIIKQASENSIPMDEFNSLIHSIFQSRGNSPSN
jgi:hypothetical protein